MRDDNKERTMTGIYEIKESYEHCHRCKKLAVCIVRWNSIRPQDMRKTALCLACALKEQPAE